MDMIPVLDLTKSERENAKLLRSACTDVRMLQSKSCIYSSFTPTDILTEVRVCEYLCMSYIFARKLCALTKNIRTCMHACTQNADCGCCDRCTTPVMGAFNVALRMLALVSCPFAKIMLKNLRQSIL
jgi:hypothetical protein